ncbi:MAG: alpha-amylase, partial [Eudoraea sp.]|nr:alpha-amylase [Eudoraea sp.]
MKKLLIAIAVSALFLTCKQEEKKTQIPDTKVQDSTQIAQKEVPFVWQGANIYFLLTDRFNNGNPDNDLNFERTNETATLRGFMGGDIQGITNKIEEGYFSKLGVNAIWFTPVVEQIHGDTDEGTGNTYAYHGYWTKDWTALDPNFGTKKDLENLVKTAHKNNIRILLDVVVNHTGPVTEKDPVWPEDWVRTDPLCEHTNYETTTSCTLVANLPDIYTESDEAVELPDALLAKWKEEGRLSNELDELQLFFQRTGYPRAPRFYIIKWLTDYVNDLGIDGFRVDTVKHADEHTWLELYAEASKAFETWKKKHPEEVLDDTPFYMVGEAYGYEISEGRKFDFGDKKVDYFEYGFESLINFELKNDAKKNYETIFKKYNRLMNSKLKNKGVLNYLTSQDDSEPFDINRERPYYTANVLLLTPGTSQIYYGDESARDLTIENTEGDATLRSFMNWQEIDSLQETKKVLA